MSSHSGQFYFEEQLYLLQEDEKVMLKRAPDRNRMPDVPFWPCHVGAIFELDSSSCSPAVQPVLLHDFRMSRDPSCCCASGHAFRPVRSAVRQISDCWSLDLIPYATHSVKPFAKVHLSVAFLLCLYYWTCIHVIIKQLLIVYYLSHWTVNSFRAGAMSYFSY